MKLPREIFYGTSPESAAKLVYIIFILAIAETQHIISDEDRKFCRSVVCLLVIKHLVFRIGLVYDISLSPYLYQSDCFEQQCLVIFTVTGAVVSSSLFYFVFCLAPRMEDLPRLFQPKLIVKWFMAPGCIFTSKRVIFRSYFSDLRTLNLSASNLN